MEHGSPRIATDGRGWGTPLFPVPGFLVLGSRFLVLSTSTEQTS